MKMIFSVLKKNWLSVGIALLLMLGSNVFQLLMPDIQADMINNGIARESRDYLMEKGLHWLLLNLANLAIGLLSSFFTAKVSIDFGKELRRRTFVKTELLNQCDVETIGIPSLITRGTNDINRIQNMVLAFLRSIISAPIMLVAGSIMAFITNPRLSTVIIILIPVVGIGAFVVSKTVMPMFKRVQKSTDALNKILREKLSGIRVIRAFNRTKHEDERFREANHSLTALSLRINRLMALLNPISSVLVFFLIAILMSIAVSQIEALDAVRDREQLLNTMGDLTKFIMYLMIVVTALIQAVEMFFDIPRAMVSAKRINEILNMESLIREPEQPAALPVASESVKRGLITFDAVSFAYPGSTEPILRDLSFEAKPGEVTAIIGGTGSGKSTLVNLIPRFYDVSEGRILIDGVDVRDMHTSTLHNKIGFIPQKAFLFSGTVLDNLRFGREDASEEEVWEALRIAQAADFVEKLPLGLHDMIAQSGKNLSGGQKQRLAIARAIVRKSDIYVFDDSFSALDYTTDARLRHALKTAMRDAAMVIVAQRIGTILRADQILVLDGGSIVGKGTHAELLQSCPTYREIALSQLPEEELAI